MGSGMRERLFIAALLAGGGTGTGSARARKGAPPALPVQGVSNRADVISGGDALVAVDLPAGTDPSTVKVTVGSRDVTDQFAQRPDGRFEGLVTGLDVGGNVLRATLPSGATGQVTIVDHATGG